MRRDGYLGASGENSDIDIRFFDPDFLIHGEILTISSRFQLIFSPDNPIIRHISLLPVYLTYWQWSN